MRRISTRLPILLLAIGATRAAAQAPPPPDEPAAPAQPNEPDNNNEPLPPPPPPEQEPPPPAPVMVPQPTEAEPIEAERRLHWYVEGFGNWGVNLGETSYVPNGAPGTSKHPFATGFGGGAKVGFLFAPDWLSVYVAYRYGHTSTRTGELIGALTKVQGTLSYHSLTAGLRLEHRAGPGSVYADFGIGALVPFHTTLTQDYAPELGPLGIVGTGTMEQDFGWAFGAEGEMGYHVDLTPCFYLGAGLHVATFQGSNPGRDTILTNFVTDFTALPPVPVTATIHHGTHGPATPTTYSVQDIRILISVGYRF